MRRSIVAIALVALLAHLLTLSRYGFYRDELYFLACFRHLAWGYVDQPPLIPLLSGAGLLLHSPLFGMRVLTAIAATLTILAAAAIARELGARRFGQIVTAIATALMPGSLFLGNTLTTTSFEPLTWTLAILFALRLARNAKPSTWLLLAVTLTLAAYMKYSVFLLIATLAVAAALRAAPRLALALAAAGATAALLLGPNIAWQAAHGLPILAVLHGDVAGRHPFNAGPQYEFAGTLRNTPAFLIEQLAFPGPLSAPLWIAGLVAFWRRREEHDFSFITVAYAIAVVVSLACAAKGYYLIGFYPALFAAGATSLERASRRLRIAYACVLTAAGALLAPLALPLLPVDALVAYTHAFGAPNELMQPLFADEFGWNQLAARVAHAYDSLPQRERATALFADTYADAAALDYYGPRYALPAPISAQNQYYLWGTHGSNLSRVLAIGASEYSRLRILYRSVRIVGTFSDPRRRVIEGPTPIYLCTHPLLRAREIWTRLKWYGA